MRFTYSEEYARVWLTLNADERADIERLKSFIRFAPLTGFYYMTDPDGVKWYSVWGARFFLVYRLEGSIARILRIGEWAGPQFD